MVSAFWSACSEGNVSLLMEVFADSSQVDLDLKDDAGNTPLIQAVKGGHIEVVKILIEKGANPALSSPQGFPADHTTDPEMLLVLGAPHKNQPALPQPNDVPVPESNGVYPPHESQAPPPMFYPPPGVYPYYPPGPGLPDGPAFYAPFPLPPLNGDGGPGNLPPPEIARLIPCRYFPACRYGSSCMFAHPPQGPYTPGPVPPPGSYPYDSMVPRPYPPPFYPPHAFPQNAIPPPVNGSSSPVTPHSNTNGATEGGPPNPQYSPDHSPVPPTQFPPVSPTGYAHPSQLPTPIPAPIPQPTPNGVNGTHDAHSPSAAYPPIMQGQYPPMPENAYAPPPIPNGNGIAYSPTENTKPSHGDSNGSLLPPQKDSGHARKGSMRRPSFSRKPPCLFFPVGKCKNGTECRFPHIMPENGQRNGARPTRAGIDGVHGKTGNPTLNTRGMNGFGGRGGKAFNGAKGDRKAPAPNKQKVPSADDFPVLAGTISPPPRSPAPNGTFTGPTAAQVLQAPPPRKEATGGTDSSDTPSESSHGDASESRSLKDEPENAPPPPEDHKVAEATPTSRPTIPKKLPMSFAAAIAAPEVSKEQQVSA